MFDAAWPAFDAALAAEEPVTIAVQVNGKTRGTVLVPPAAGEAEVLAAAMAERRHREVHQRHAEAR